MRKFLFLMVLCIGVVVAKAYDYPYLIFQNMDGTESPVSVEALTITYVDGHLVIAGEGVSQELDATQLSKMYFSTELSAIENLKIGDGVVAVYNLFGIYLGTYPSQQHAIHSLDKGIYVIKTAGETCKIVVP